MHLNPRTQELPDDPTTIEDDEILYRRIPDANFMVIDELTQVRRPTSAVFRPDKDGLLVYIESILSHHKLTERDVQTRAQAAVFYR